MDRTSHEKAQKIGPLKVMDFNLALREEPFHSSGLRDQERKKADEKRRAGVLGTWITRCRQIPARSQLKKLPVSTSLRRLDDLDVFQN